MSVTFAEQDVKVLVEGLNFAQKVDRSLRLIEEAWQEFGDKLVVANSLGKDSVAVWHLAKRVSPEIRGFIVTTRFKPAETVEFMHQEVARYPELRVFRNDAELPDGLHKTNPDRCCDILKVEPTRRAIEEMDSPCAARRTMRARRQSLASARCSRSVCSSSTRSRRLRWIGIHLTSARTNNACTGTFRARH